MCRFYLFSLNLDFNSAALGAFIEALGSTSYGAVNRDPLESFEVKGTPGMVNIYGSE